ncbi:MAG TPA: AsmA-like C-terminal region-containing protein [Pirellulales bacterium]|nr:AsmA-like C-terminal region-containing protein [Pirellulales bacterium]
MVCWPSLAATSAAQAAPAARRSARVHWTFRDIEVQTLLGRLKRFGVELPVPATGRVTVKLAIGAPWSSLFQAGAYEVEGDLSSASLTIAGVELRKVAVHVLYAGGALDLSQMSFAVPGQNGADGTVTGHARMQMRPPGDLSAELSLARLPLATLARVVPELAGQVEGTIAGEFDGHAPADRLRNLAAWQAGGQLTLSDVRAFGLPPLSATTKMRLARGEATLTDLTADFAGAKIRASGQLGVTAPFAFRSRLQVAVPNLEWLNRLEADFKPPVDVAGAFTLSADATGQLKPRRVRVRGTLDGRDLKAGQIAVDRILVPCDGTLDRIRVNNLRIDLYGGRITANLTLPTDRDGNVGVGLKVDRVDLAHLASDLLAEKQTWRGAASGVLQLRAPAARLAEPAAWNGRGQLTFGGGNLFGIDVSRIVTNIQLADGRLSAGDLRLDSALAQVTGSAQANLTAPFGFATSLRIAEVDFAALNRLPEDFRPPVTIGGRAGVSFRAEGTLSPVRFTARGGVATRRLRAELDAVPIVVDTLNFDYRISEQTATLSRIVGSTYRGRFDGSASVTLGRQANSQVDLSWQQVDVGQMLGTFKASPLRGVRGQGTTRGRISARAAGDARDLANWQASANVSVDGLRIDRATLGNVSIEASLAQQQLTVSRAATAGGAMRVDGSGKLGLLSPHDFGLKLTVAAGDLSLANGLPAPWRPPVTLGGTVNLSADLTGSIDPVRVMGEGTFGARNVQLDRVRVDSVGFKFSGDDQTMKLSELAVVAYRGRVDGQLQVPLAEATEGSVDLRWQRINLGSLFTDVRDMAAQIGQQEAGGRSPVLEALAETRLEGWTWGSISTQTPAGKRFDPSAWTGNVDASLAAVRVFGWSAKQAFLRARLADGKAEVTRLACDIGDTRLRGTAGLQLAEPYGFESQLGLENLELDYFNRLPGSIKLPVDVAGSVSVKVQAHGKLEPFEVGGEGSVTGDKIEVDRARVDHLAIQFAAEKERLRLTSFHADLYDGAIDGQAQIALEPGEAGHVDFQWQGINVGQFATDVAKLPVTVHGTVRGKLHVDVPGGKLADPASWSADVSFDTSPVVAKATNLGELHGHLAYDGDLLDYKLDGNLLRGPLQLDGRWQPRAPGGDTSVNEGYLQLSGAHLDTLAPLLGTHGGSIAGQVGAKLQFHHAEKTGLPAGVGELSIDDLRWNRLDISSGVRGTLRVAGDRIEVTGVHASFAGGSLTASATAFLDVRRRSSFRLTASGLEIRQLLAPWPKVAALARGAVDSQLDGFFAGGRPLTLAGAAAISQARAAGIEFNGLRVPIHGSVDPFTQRGTIQLHGITGQVAHGRVTGDFDVTLAGGLGLNGRGKLANVDLRNLLEHSASGSHLASGKISGNYTLAGRNIRGVNDLTGSLDATLTDTQAMSLPILASTIPYLTGGISGSTNFDQGTVRGSLSRGVVRVDQFSLSSGSVKLYAEGKVTLAGRLDMNVTAQTGDLNPSSRALTMVASRVLLVAAPPVGALMTVTQFLSNQVINLEVTGTIRSPTIRIQPLQLVGQEAAQFFLLQGVP